MVTNWIIFGHRKSLKWAFTYDQLYLYVHYRVILIYEPCESIIECHLSVTHDWHKTRMHIKHQVTYDSSLMFLSSWAMIDFSMFPLKLKDNSSMFSVLLLYIHTKNHQEDTELTVIYIFCGRSSAINFLSWREQG